jgi:hypothetical protein
MAAERHLAEAAIIGVEHPQFARHVADAAIGEVNRYGHGADPERSISVTTRHKPLSSSDFAQACPKRRHSLE